MVVLLEFLRLRQRITRGKWLQQMMPLWVKWQPPLTSSYHNSLWMITIFTDDNKMTSIRTVTRNSLMSSMATSFKPTPIIVTLWSIKLKTMILKWTLLRNSLFTSEEINTIRCSNKGKWMQEEGSRPITCFNSLKIAFLMSILATIIDFTSIIILGCPSSRYILISNYKAAQQDHESELIPIKDLWLTLSK